MIRPRASDMGASASGVEPPKALCEGVVGDGVGHEPRKTSVIDYLERGLRRMARPKLAINGKAKRDADGRSARFSLEVQGGVIIAARFEASACTALIAYCEVLAESVPTLTLGEALNWSAGADITAALPGIPPYKRYLAELAAGALRSSVYNAVERHSP